MPYLQAFCRRLILSGFSLPWLVGMLLSGSCSQSGTVREASSSRPKAAHGHQDRARGSRVPSLKVRLIKGDKGLDKDRWQQLSRHAACTEWFVDPRDGRSVKGMGPEAKACVAANQAGMYVRFTVKDPDVVGGFEPGARDQQVVMKVQM